MPQDGDIGFFLGAFHKFDGATGFWVPITPEDLAASGYSNLNINPGTQEVVAQRVDTGQWEVLRKLFGEYGKAPESLYSTESGLFGIAPPPDYPTALPWPPVTKAGTRTRKVAITDALKEARAAGDTALADTISAAKDRGQMTYSVTEDVPAGLDYAAVRAAYKTYSPEAAAQKEANVQADNARADATLQLQRQEFAYRQQRDALAAQERAAARQKEPTFGDLVDRTLRSWAETGDDATLQRALQLDAVRNQIEGQNGISYREAVGLAAQYANSPEEMKQWLQVLTNPFGVSRTLLPAAQRVPTQAEVAQQFAYAAQQPGAPPVEPGTQKFLGQQGLGTNELSPAFPGGPGFTFSPPQTPEQGAAFSRLFPGNLPPVAAPVVPDATATAQDFSQVLPGPLQPVSQGAGPATGVSADQAEAQATGLPQAIRAVEGAATQRAFRQAQQRFGGPITGTPVGKIGEGVFAQGLSVTPAQQAAAAQFLQPVTAPTQPDIQAQVLARGGAQAGGVAMRNPQTGEIAFPGGPGGIPGEADVAALQGRGFQVVQDRRGEKPLGGLPPVSQGLNPFEQLNFDIAQRKKQRQQPAQPFRFPAQFIGAA